MTAPMAVRGARSAQARRRALARRPALQRTFEAVLVSWVGTAVPDPDAPAGPVRRRLDALCAAGTDVVLFCDSSLLSGFEPPRARAAEAGRLLLCVDHGAEIFEMTAVGPRPVHQRVPSPEEHLALQRAAVITSEQLAQHGLMTRVLAPVGHHHRVDLLPLAEWANPPRERLDELFQAVSERLRRHALADPSVVVDAARAAAVTAGVASPRVISDGKHVEIGLTDEGDAMRWVLGDLASRGIGPGLVLVCGSQFGPLAGLAGPDIRLLVPEAARSPAVSVGGEPTGVPPNVLHLGGGPDQFLRLLDEQMQRRRDGRVPEVDRDPLWTVPMPGPDRGRQRSLESVFTLGDGEIATRGAVEEDGPGSTPLVAANGVYAGTGSGQHLLPGPDWVRMPIDPAPQAEVYTLDLRGGVLLREERGGAVPLRTLRFVSAARPGTFALRAEAGPRRFDSGTPLQPGAGGFEDSGEIGEVAWRRARSDGTGGITAAAVEQSRVIDGLRTLDRLASYVADSARSPEPAEAVAGLAAARALGFDRLLADHREHWARRWAAVDIEVPDAPDVQLAARFALFHLWNNVAPRGEAGVGARGLSGSGYSGHVFWDADVFVLPAVAAMDPARARAMLEYRLRRLPQARAAAAKAGRRGAWFPWESAQDGFDVTPQVVYGQGPPTLIRTGQLEQHIVSDVAWAACHYAEWVGDTAFLAGPGRDLVVEGARFWASRIRSDPAGRVHVYDVIGPDEYHESVDDSAYTNVMARWQLRRAAALVERDGDTAERAEAARWRRFADALVDGYDELTGRYEQFAGYYRLRPLFVTDVAPPPVAADLLIGMQRVSESQLIKQVDVLMLHHLVPDEVASGSLLPNLDFYGPRTAHGSSLSPAIQASLLARAGRPDEALDLLRLALRLDLDDLTRTTSGGLHLATMGACVQAFLFGFAGVRVRDGVLSVDPILPSDWRRLTLRFRCLGRQVILHARPDEITLSADGELPVTMPGLPPAPGGPVTRFVRTDEGWARA